MPYAMRRMDLKRQKGEEERKKDDFLYRWWGGGGRNRLLLHAIIDLPILKPDVSKKISFLQSTLLPTFENWFELAFPLLVTQNLHLFLEF